PDVDILGDEHHARHPVAVVRKAFLVLVEARKIWGLRRSSWAKMTNPRFAQVVSRSQKLFFQSRVEVFTPSSEHMSDLRIEVVVQANGLREEFQQSFTLHLLQAFSIRKNFSLFQSKVHLGFKKPL